MDSLKSKLLNSICRYVCHVFYRSKSEARGKKSDSIIKKINKENKYLFGDLLETKSQKNKRELQISLGKKIENHTCQKNHQNSSEISWHINKSSKNIVYFHKDNISSTKSSIVPDFQTIDNTEKNVDIETNKINKIVSKTPRKPYKHVSICDNGSRKNEIHNAVISLKENSSSKSPSLQLPDIIIKNITTFPLVNNNKEHLEWEIPVQSVLNLSVIEGYKNRKEYLMYPSVSKILNSTLSDSSRAALMRWRQNMIATLGEEGFLTLYRGQLARGSQFHSIVQSYLSGTPASDLKLKSDMEGCWQSLLNIIPDITNVKVLESHVIHSSLMYRGVIDCVAQYQGKPVLIEWKKSEKQKPEIDKTYDAPIQLCAYIGAMNYDIKYNFQVQGGIVVVAYTDGSPAHIFSMSISECNKYWKIWLNRLQQYWLQQESSTNVIT